MAGSLRFWLISIIAQPGGRYRISAALCSTRCTDLGFVCASCLNSSSVKDLSLASNTSMDGCGPGA
eukprot:1118561-Alexandrium_andersonii.AAC.1